MSTGQSLYEVYLKECGWSLATAEWTRLEPHRQRAWATAAQIAASTGSGLDARDAIAIHRALSEAISLAP
jgi:hypothetical protein